MYAVEHDTVLSAKVFYTTPCGKRYHVANVSIGESEFDTIVTFTGPTCLRQVGKVFEAVKVELNL